MEVYLLVAMEDEFAISIVPTEITQEEVSSVNRIIALLRNKGLEIGCVAAKNSYEGRFSNSYT